MRGVRIVTLRIDLGSLSPGLLPNAAKLEGVGGLPIIAATSQIPPLPRAILRPKARISVPTSKQGRPLSLYLLRVSESSSFAKGAITSA